MLPWFSRRRAGAACQFIGSARTLLDEIQKARLSQGFKGVGPCEYQPAGLFILSMCLSHCGDPHHGAPRHGGAPQHVAEVRRHGVDSVCLIGGHGASLVCGGYVGHGLCDGHLK